MQVLAPTNEQKNAKKFINLKKNRLKFWLTNALVMSITICWKTDVPYFKKRILISDAAKIKVSAL